MNTLRCAVLLLLLMVFGSVKAEDGENAVKFSLNVAALSVYVGSSGMLVYNGPVLQTSATLLYRSCYGNMWWSYSPSKGPNGDWGDELDASLGCQGRADVFGLKMAWDAMVSYYEFAPIDTSRGDIVALTLKLSLPDFWVGWSPYLKIREDIPMNNNVLSGGFLYWVRDQRLC